MASILLLFDAVRRGREQHAFVVYGPAGSITAFDASGKRVYRLTPQQPTE